MQMGFLVCLIALVIAAEGDKEGDLEEKIKEGYRDAIRNATRSIISRIKIEKDVFMKAAMERQNMSGELVEPAQVSMKEGSADERGEGSDGTKDDEISMAKKIVIMAVLLGIVGSILLLSMEFVNCICELVMVFEREKECSNQNSVSKVL